MQKYREENSWVSEISVKSQREMQTSVELKAPLELLEPTENGDLKDIENAIRVHKALPQLTPLQARDPRLWTRLAHVECWPYMRKRWNKFERYLQDEAKAARYVESHYFVPRAESRALLRNGVARLWWTAKVSHDPARDNPYELVAVLLSTLDITQQILERGIGRAPAVLMGFLEFLNRNKDVLLTGGDENRIRIRRLAKFLNMHGGVCILDSLTQPQIMALLETEFARILAMSNGNTNQPVSS
ncbi:MAG: DUF6339 family protein [Limisphaerales bacterium]